TRGASAGVRQARAIARARCKRSVAVTRMVVTPQRCARLCYDAAVPPSGGIPFGNYTLVRRLARGGMAEVFVARQMAQAGVGGWGRAVAVKRILPHLADSPEFTRMFLAEAKLAARLSHPNIVHIYDVGRVEDDYFIAMELVDGVHGAQLVQHHERLPPVL